MVGLKAPGEGAVFGMLEKGLKDPSRTHQRGEGEGRNFFVKFCLSPHFLSSLFYGFCEKKYKIFVRGQYIL